MTERTTPLIVDFFATWCGPCVMMSKELEAVRGTALGGLGVPLQC